MRFLLTGLNHKTAPVDVRERLAFDDQALPEALDRLKNLPGMREGIILSTCNRVEVSVTAEESADAESAIETFLADARHVERSWVRPYLYKYNGREAIQHLFRVASSLDSMVVGEPQILGQLKAAYAAAKQQGSIASGMGSGFLDLVFTRAFNVAKRVRTETDIGQSAVSVSYAAVELAREIFGSLKDKRVLVVGAGKMAESAARHLRRAGVKEILVANRTFARAETMAEACGGKPIQYEYFEDVVPNVDIVLASSGAPHYILTAAQMRAAMAKRRNQPMFLIDIAVPRNIDPEVNKVESVFLYDIDDLGKTVDDNLRNRIEVAKEAEAIINEEAERLVARLRTRTVTPAIVALQEQLEAVRRGEMERHRGKLGALTPQQEEALEAITRGLMNKIAHGAISELRSEAGNPEAEALIRRLFRLGEK